MTIETGRRHLGPAWTGNSDNLLTTSRIPGRVRRLVRTTGTGTAGEGETPPSRSRPHDYVRVVERPGLQIIGLPDRRMRKMSFRCSGPLE